MVIIVGQKKNDMIVLLDCDSLAYSCSWGVETKEDASYKFDQHIMYIVNHIEEEYGSDNQYQFYHGSSGNFRNEITSTYKANRKQEKPEHYHYLSSYIKEAYSAISADGEEVDDLIARTWEELTEDGQRSVHRFHRQGLPTTPRT